MRLEMLFQFIVPLMFLAIWALTSLLNRDSQPLPQRPTRPGARPGPGPGTGMEAGRGPAPAGGFGQAQESFTSGAPRDLTQRTSGAVRTGDPQAAANLNDANIYIMGDEVVFVDPNTNLRIMSAPIRNAAATVAAERGAAKSLRSSQPRKAGRGRRAASPTRPVPTEPETRRALSDQMGLSMSMSRGRPLDVTRLSSKLTPLSASMTSSAPTRDLGLERAASGPALQADEVKYLLSAPRKLRESILLAEILQPPVSMRRRPRSG